MSPPGCVIVIPCYNEAARLDADRFAAFAAAAPPDTGLLLVNDGSTDRTAEMLAALAERVPGRLRAMQLPANLGKANAVRAGALAAIADGAAFVGYWDADLSAPLRLVPRFRSLLDARPDLIGVLGSRVKMLGTRIDRSASRHYLGRVFATVASAVLGLGVYDTQCGAKLFRVCPALRAAFAAPFRSRWAFDVELLARLDLASRAAGGPPVGDLLVELPLEEWRHVAGSKLRPTAMVRAALELLAVRRNAAADVRKSQVVNTLS
ncbi:MAG TPA: glycosyltransferase [Gemmatimonadales bacterium]|nr:glycosyltransferase [Gemmatimonadales bacterium]